MNRLFAKRIFSCPADCWAAAIWAAAVALRVWGAWISRCITEPDPTVVALMARHMAALKDFPVFFYGQAYMGSLEPMASALMIRMMGPTGFAVTLGPVIFAALALLLLWRWARDAAGPWGGVAALLFAGVGPSVYFQFQMAARGGYMVALCVDAASLWMAARIAAELRGGRNVLWFRFLLLGFVAGLGLWSNWIVVPALCVAALLIVHGMRWTCWRYPAGFAAGLAGTLTGMLPWWIYNFNHNWASLGMSQISGHTPLREALLNSWNRFLVLQMPGRMEPGAWLPYGLAIGVLVVAAAGILPVFRQLRDGSLRRSYARVAAVLFCALFVWVFVTSGFTRTRTARYWVPLVPGLAVLAAVACTAPGRRGRQVAAWSLLGALTLVQAGQSVLQMTEAGRRVEDCQTAFREIGEALASTGADALLAPLQLYSLNVALDEKLPVSDGRQSFYGSILRAVELAENPAYASDYNGIGTFLQQQGAAWETTSVAGHSILWNVKRPQVPVHEYDAGEITGISKGKSESLTSMLRDHNIDTWWTPGTAAPAALEWTFPEPMDVRGIELLFAHGMADESFDFPRSIRIEVQVAGEWKTVLADDPIVPLEWSGNRVYTPSGLAHLEYRMNEPKAEALRVTLFDTRADVRHVGWRLAEAYVMWSPNAVVQAQDAAAVDQIGKKISEYEADSLVYAPRWLSNQLLKRGWVPEDRLAGLNRRAFPKQGNPVCSAQIDTDRTCVFVVPWREYLGSEQVMEQTVSCRIFESAPWSLFVVDQKDWMDASGLPPALSWAGDRLLLGNSAARAGVALHRLREGGEPEEVRKGLLDEIVKWHPALLSALSEEETLRLGGEAAVQARQAAACVPPVPCVTEFANGIRLEGVFVEPETVRPGGEVTIRLFWSVTEDSEPGQEIVFIHLRDADGHMVAQEDYHGSPLLWGSEAVRSVPGEEIEDIRTIRLPENAVSGPLDITVGLYQPQNGRRVRICKSQAPEVHRNAAKWPQCLTVLH